MIFDVEIPDWVNWIAQDADGMWYGYAVPPIKRDDDWDSVSMVDLARGPIPKDWTQELYEVIR